MYVFALPENWEEDYFLSAQCVRISPCSVWFSVLPYITVACLSYLKFKC